jgi:hypothetical protein
MANRMTEPRTDRNAAGRKSMLKMLKFLARGEARLERTDGTTAVLHHEGSRHDVPAGLLAEAVSRGLVAAGQARASLAPPARAYLRRAIAEREEAFIEQHGEIGRAVRDIEGTPRSVRVNDAESPLAVIARLKDREGGAFLPTEALGAGERLLADFTRAQLRPRVTSAWQPRLSGRSNGGRGGMADLTDSAVAARIAVNRAIEAMGPELSGVALDVCCFMKGLETVERERQWPVRSAKLMLRTALLALARHYDPPRRSARMQHWGEEGYRPEI